VGTVSHHKANASVRIQNLKFVAVSLLAVPEILQGIKF